MRNAGLEETLAGIKIARRNINNLTYVDDTTLNILPVLWNDSLRKWFVLDNQDIHFLQVS